MTRLVDAVRWVIRGSRLLHHDPDNLRRIPDGVGSWQNGQSGLPDVASWSLKRQGEVWLPSGRGLALLI
jgi:hypothetical protein